MRSASHPQALFAVFLVVCCVVCVALATWAPRAANAEPNAERCAQIRQVRALAVVEGLDESTLLELAARYCGDAAAPASASEDCGVLRLMTALAATDGTLPGAQRAELRTLTRVVCEARGGDSDRRDWSNNATAKSSSGRWDYPNGVTALSTSGRWDYPNGVTAKSTSGRWDYPNGVTAYSTSGRWDLPDGQSVSSVDSLLSAACVVVGDAACDDHLARIQSAAGDLQHAEIIRLVWLAHVLATK